MNRVFGEIQSLFAHAGEPDFSKNPADMAVRGKFAKLFRELNEYLEAAKVQGFTWSKPEYHSSSVAMALDERVYLILAQRYKELFTKTDITILPDIPYEIDSHLTEIDTSRIDAEYMNSRFKKYLKELGQNDIDPDELQATLDDLHKSFAALTQEEQKFANIFLHDIQNGAVQVESGKSFRDYITEYMIRAKNDQIHRVAVALGLDEEKLRRLMDAHVSESTLNEYGRYDDLISTVDKAKARAYFESVEGIRLTPPKVLIKTDKLLRSFILNGGMDIS